MDGPNHRSKAGVSFRLGAQVGGVSGGGHCISQDTAIAVTSPNPSRPRRPPVPVDPAAKPATFSLLAGYVGAKL